MADNGFSIQNLRGISALIHIRHVSGVVWQIRWVRSFNLKLFQDLRNYNVKQLQRRLIRLSNDSALGWPEKVARAIDYLVVFFRG